MEDFDMGDRLSRGKNYARRGQVASIDVRKGSVSAKVQGSDYDPYDVRITIRQISAANWKRVAKRLFERPVLAAEILSGRMPADIEEVFGRLGLSLLPGQTSDLKTGCSCYDWANPCKHIAAVYLLLGEEFDRDPFLIFRMRGIERAELLELAGLQDMSSESGDKASEEPAPEPLESDPDRFWTGDVWEDFGQAHVPQVAAALPKRLGSFPFWRGKETFLDEMEWMYGDASPAGRDAFLAERAGGPAGRGKSQGA